MCMCIRLVVSSVIFWGGWAPRWKILNLPQFCLTINLSKCSPPQALALMSNQSSSGAAASMADKPSKSPPVRPHAEKQERPARLLQELPSRASEKSSEKLATKEREREGGGVGEGGRSESPTSTLSSGGEREGGYSLLVDPLDSADESGECHMTVTRQSHDHVQQIICWTRTLDYPRGPPRLSCWRSPESSLPYPPSPPPHRCPPNGEFRFPSSHPN